MCHSQFFLLWIYCYFKIQWHSLKKEKKKTHSNVDSVTTKWCQWPFCTCSPPRPPFLTLSSPCLLFSATMVNRRISDDLKLAVLRLKACGCDSVSEILDIVGFSKKTFYHVQGQFRRIGTVAKANAIRHGRPQKILLADMRYLVCLACHKPTLFLDEYRSHLERYCLLTVSMVTIHRTLEWAGLNVKQVQKMGSECDPIHWADFIHRITQYPASCLLSIDEVSKDDRTYTHLWGRSEVRSRVEVHQPFCQKQCFSMLAALVLDKGIVAADVIKGSFTQELFIKFLRDDVVCICSHWLIFSSYIHYILSAPTHDTTSWPSEYGPYWQCSNSSPPRCDWTCGKLWYVAFLTFWLFITLFLRVSCGISPPLLTPFHAHWTGILCNQISSSSPGTGILQQWLNVLQTLQRMQSHYTWNDLGIFSSLWLLCWVVSSNINWSFFMWISTEQQGQDNSTKAEQKNNTMIYHSENFFHRCSASWSVPSSPSRRPPSPRRSSSLIQQSACGPWTPRSMSFFLSFSGTA